MERLTSHVCLPCAFGWNDLGSWDAVAEVVERNELGCELRRDLDLHEINSSGCFVVPQKDKTYAILNTQDLLVVDTEDALLLSARGDSEGVKAAVELVKQAKQERAARHNFEFRPWGQYQVVHRSNDFKAKIISVAPGERLSYQSHANRSEHWIIVKGSGHVVLNDREIQVKAGDHVFVPAEAKHRIVNTGEEPLQFFEVQVGSYLGEDDIVRYQDSYGRIESDVSRS